MSYALSELAAPKRPPITSLERNLSRRVELPCGTPQPALSRPLISRSLAAHGGLVGPVTGVMRFAQMHLNGGELEGVWILSPESVALMQEMQHSTGGDPLGIGLAWFVVDDAEHPYIEHDGGGVGIWDKMQLYPQDGLAIVLMSKASGWERDRVGDAAANVVFSMLGR